MYDPQKIGLIAEYKEEWNNKFKNNVKQWSERKAEDDFITISDRKIKRLYTPEDINDLDYLRDIGFPGEYPFTRGVYPTMYRGRLWTMRQFSGFGTPEDTNRRYHYLIEHGQTGLSVAFHMPTLYGYDSDSPRAYGEVGKCGVAVDSLLDMEIIFDGIPLDKISTSMTINAPSIILLAMYIAVAEKQGVPQHKLSGTNQTDILKEYIAQKSWIYPPEPSMRIITDMFEYCSKFLPRWNPVSISGYHIREAGATAVQELAFTLADGLAYIDAGLEAGLNIDDFAPRLSFFFDSQIDFFEEIAKFRAARRIWAREMKKRGAKNPRSLLMRFHTQTAGVSLTYQQPLNNIIRTAFEALAAVLGGTQSLHTNSFDEAWALPSEEAVLVALRTQQIIAEETGVANTIDPLAGSYFVEALTNQMEKECYEYFEKIEALGGVIPAIKKNFFQREIAEAAYKHQRDIESGRKIIVGVNKYKIEEDELPAELLEVDEIAQNHQITRTKRLRKERDNKAVKKALDEIRRAAAGSDNIMYPILDAVRVYATLGEIIDAMKDVFGEYKEQPLF